MPELPEVETIAHDLRKAGVPGRRIAAVRVFWNRIVACPAPPVFKRRLMRRVIERIARRGKLIVLRLSGGYVLCIHLRMTGQVDVVPAGQPRDVHEHIILSLDDGRELRFRDTRKFGRWSLTRTPDTILRRMGPDAIGPSLSLSQFVRRLALRRRQLKPLLLDQAFLAGLGNIYTDEALWAAKLHPLRRSDTLSRKEIKALYGAIRRVLRRGIKDRGTSLGNGRANFIGLNGRRGRHQRHLNAYGQTGKPCPRCRTPIRRLRVGQRGTHICPLCQR